MVYHPFDRAPESCQISRGHQLIGLTIGVQLSGDQTTLARIADE